MVKEEGLVREFKAGEALVKVYRDRQSMGKAAARTVGEKMKKFISEKGEVSMVFASAPSQEEFLAELARIKGIDWSKVIAFHLDEYVGLPSDAPQAFGEFLRRRLFNKVNPRRVYYLNGNAEDLEEEARRYGELLKRYELDIACIGIGENGHIAFNDPHVADFNDPLMVKIVELDEVSRQQQVNDGCFASIEQVPQKALTITIPVIMSAKFISVVVPAKSKAQAIKRTIQGSISEECPASILRTHENTVMFLDMDSASLI